MTDERLTIISLFGDSTDSMVKDPEKECRCIEDGTDCVELLVDCLRVYVCLYICMYVRFMTSFKVLIGPRNFRKNHKTRFIKYL